MFVCILQRGLPHSLDGRLQTEGSFKIPGAPDAPYFGAHHRITTDPTGQSKRMVGFTFTEEGLDAGITVYEFDEAFNCVANTKAKFAGVSAAAVPAESVSALDGCVCWYIAGIC